MHSVLVTSLSILFQIPRLVFVLFVVFSAIGSAAQKALATSSTTTNLVISNNSSSNGSSVADVPEQSVITLTATVNTGSDVVASGQISFCELPASLCADIHLVGTAQITADGKAVVRLVPAPGTHQYKAIFGGTRTLFSSTSDTQSLTVQSSGVAKSITAITYSGGPGDYSLTATIPRVGNALPTGVVSFLDSDNMNYVLGRAGLAGKSSEYTLSGNGTYPAGHQTESIVTADFNGDGFLDIASVAQDALNLGSITILLGKGDGTFAAAPTIVTGLLACCIVSGDFNNDGKPDLAFGDSLFGSVTILLGNGDGTFSLGSTIPIPGTFADAGRLAVGDFNRDGNLDIVAGDSLGGDGPGKLLVLLGHGDGTFDLSPTQAWTGQNPYYIAVGDFNRDGLSDVAVLNEGAADSLTEGESISVLLGNGDGTFTPTSEVSLPTRSAYIVTADFDNDGKLDLAVANSGDLASPQIDILLGNGDGSFTSAANPIYLQNLDGIAVGDFNGDGIPDLAAFLPGAPTPQNVVVLLGKGNATFIPVTADGTGIPYFGVAGDFNGDGLWDLAVGSNQQDDVTIYLSSDPNAATSTLEHVSPVGNGTHFVFATYSGDGNYSPSESSAVPLVAERVNTAFTLAVSPSGTTIFGQPISLMGSLNPDQVQDHSPTGYVTFSTNSVPFGVSIVEFGYATLDDSLLSVGTDTIEAQYSGDENFSPSTASTVHTVTPAQGPTDFSFTGPATITFSTGAAGSAILSLSSINSYGGTIDFSCKQPVTLNYSCTITPISVNLVAGGSTTATLTVIPTYESLASPHRTFFASAGYIPLIGLFPFMIFFSASRKHGNKVALLCVALLFTATVCFTGCGPDLSRSADQAGEYTIAVTASGFAPDQSTPITHVLQLKMYITP